MSVSMPPYSIIGNGKSKKGHNDINMVDALAVVGSLAPSQLKIFLRLRDHITIKYYANYKSKYPSENPNEVILSNASKEDKEILKLLQRNNNSKHMIDKQILKKRRKNIYMVNPFLLIPPSDFEHVSKIWGVYGLGVINEHFTYKDMFELVYKDMPYEDIPFNL